MDECTGMKKVTGPEAESFSSATSHPARHGSSVTPLSGRATPLHGRTQILAEEHKDETCLGENSSGRGCNESVRTGKCSIHRLVVVLSLS
jgi:hypothetical protein